VRSVTLDKRPHVHNMPGDRRGSCHRRRDEVGAAAITLPIFEIAVRRGGAACEPSRAIRRTPRDDLAARMKTSTTLSRWRRGSGTESESALTSKKLRPAFREILAVFRWRRFWFDDRRTSKEEMAVAELPAVARVACSTRRQS